MLGEIEALKESVLARIGSIEDGSFWDDQDDWDGPLDDEPDYVSEEQGDELYDLFLKADDLFMADRLTEAREVYAALFDLVEEADNSGATIDSRDLYESRARYARAVFETSPSESRVADLLTAMDVETTERIHDPAHAGLPFLQDVLDARASMIEGMERFWPDWEDALSRFDPGLDRPALLRLEAMDNQRGIAGVAELARQWSHTQPHGYLFLINRLAREKDWNAVIATGREALATLPDGSFREKAARVLVAAGSAIGDRGVVLEGKRESFFSCPSEEYLLDLVAEASGQNHRAQELDQAITCMENRKSLHSKADPLLVKALLMAGRLEDAFQRVRSEKGLGWSGGSAGLVFSSIISRIIGFDPGAVTVSALFTEYAETRSFFPPFSSSGQGKDSTSFAGEMAFGLKGVKLPDGDMARYFEWAEKIGSERVDGIVAGKHRSAYDRAARVLGAMAEAHILMGQKEKAFRLLESYYHEKYNRHSAFRREVKSVAAASRLLGSLRVV